MAEAEGLSIEETNKLRAQLGLKPLKVPSAAAAAPAPAEAEIEKKNQEEKKQREQDQRDAEALARLEKVRAKRAITAKIQGTALGEELADDAELDDAAAWVARQKQRMADGGAPNVAATASTTGRPAKRERREDSTKQHGDDDLKDVKVGHKYESIQEGETVILTLADAPVLDAKTRSVSEAADVLENVSIRDKERQAKIEEEKKKLKSGRVYDPYAENKSILSQYDEEEERVTFSLSAATTAAVAPSRDEVKARLAAAPSVSLAADKVVASEYLTAEEVKFRAPKPKRIVRKKKTSTLVKELEEEAAAAATTSTTAASTDHGSRHEVAAERAADEAAQKAERVRIQKENYEKALEKATAASATLLPVDPKKRKAEAEVKKASREEEPFEDEAEEEMLAAVTAARARNQVVRPADIAEQVLARRAAIKKEDEGDVKPSSFASAAASAGEVTFSTTTEFLRAVQPSSASSHAQAVAARTAAVAAQAQAVAETQAMDVDGAKLEEDEAESKSHGTDDMLSEEGETAHKEAMPLEAPVSRSMAAALQYVQQRGTALERDMEVWSGRKSDKPIRPEEQGGGDLRLMYVDEFGVAMTPKEAWRHMCHAFHGKHPSKNKREKMLKRREAMMAAKQTNATAGIVGQVDTMIKTQEKLQSPFIVVSSSTPAPLIAAASAAKPDPASSSVAPKIEGFSLKGGKPSKR